MPESVLLALITYLPATLVALTGLTVALMNVAHLAHLDHAVLAVETKQAALHPITKP